VECLQPAWVFLQQCPGFSTMEAYCQNTCSVNPQFSSKAQPILAPNSVYTLQRNLWYFVRWCCHLGNRFTTRSTNQRWLIAMTDLLYFYARKQLLFSSRLSHRNSVRPSVCPSVRHMDGSVKSGASYQIFTVSCTELSLCDPDREFGTLCINLAWTPQFSANIPNRNCYRLSRVSWALAQVSCFTTVNSSNMKTAADRHSLAACHNKHCWQAIWFYGHQWPWTTLNPKTGGSGDVFAT